MKNEYHIYIIIDSEDEYQLRQWIKNCKNTLLFKNAKNIWYMKQNETTDIKRNITDNINP